MRHERRAGVVVVAGCLVALAAFGAPSEQAQERPQYPPEVIAILGDPNAPTEAEDGLDAGIIAVLGEPEKAPLKDPRAIETTAAAIAVKIRCPVCQGVAVSDSPSGMAVKMREQIREMVGLGYSEEQVIRYFERSYGEFVRLEPPMQGLNLFLWILPAVVLLGGVMFVFYRARRPAMAVTGVKSEDAAGPTPVAPAEVDPALARYLERIRRDSGAGS